MGIKTEIYIYQQLTNLYNFYYIAVRHELYSWVERSENMKNIKSFSDFIVYERWKRENLRRIQ